MWERADVTGDGIEECAVFVRGGVPPGLLLMRLKGNKPVIRHLKKDSKIEAAFWPAPASGSFELRMIPEKKVIYLWWGKCFWDDTATCKIEAYQ